jgi:phospholipid-translocating ATPase
MLSVVTPLGQFEPIFLPEGIPPASQILQRTVIEIFHEFLEWMIVIFDNFLILAHSYDDAYDKLERVFHRCIERNLVLKFKKSFLGFPYANFFGYICHPGHFALSDKRKSAIQDIPFPTKLKEMQSFLGAANFFSSHVPRYSEVTAPLFGMLHKYFDWSNPSSWTQDYEAIFQSLKEALLNSCSIFYPDYSLDWTLRTDASIVGVSAALFQLSPLPNNTFDWQPIGLASHKFSDVATRWTTIEQEAYGCYFGILSFESKLRGKNFLLETDHRNLIWMEKSVVPKIVRWVLYMKSFNFQVRHVPGKLNNVADHLSRYFNHHLSDPLLLEFPDLALHSLPLDSLLLHSLSLNQSLPPVEEGGEPVPPAPPPAPDIEKVLQSVHNGRRGHWGLRQTMKILDTSHPGHRIPVQTVADFIARCPICQKNRQGMADTLQPMVRHLKPDHKRKAIGVDMLTITPTDKFGNTYLIVIVVHFTKLAWGYPSASKDATVLAKALITFFSIYGLYDTIMSDPGSDLTSNLTEELTKSYGIQHVFSLVNRHESNGVEGTNKQILRHLRALTHEERIIDQWSSPSVLPVIFFIINSHVSSETGIAPFEAHFGSEDATYFKIPPDLSPNAKQSEFLRLLNLNLKTLYSASKRFQDEIVKTRTKNNNPTTQNIFQAGDYVLLQHDSSTPRSSKLSPAYMGPYVVISQQKNDVTARHMSSGIVKVLHVELLKRFYGTEAEAKEAANIDQDQYEVECIIGYRGEPEKRSTMQFGLLFKAGDTVWKYYCKDISDTQYFETFCEARPELKRLLTTEAIAKAKTSAINKIPISDSLANASSFMNLRIYGYEKYSKLGLEDHDCRIYLVAITFGSVNAKKTRIWISDKKFKKKFQVDHATIIHYCAYDSVQQEKGMYFVQ